MPWTALLVLAGLLASPATAEAKDSAAEGSASWTMPQSGTGSDAITRPAPQLQPSHPASQPTDPTTATGMAPPPAADEVPADDEPSPPFIDLMVGAHAPLAVVGGASVELPGRLLAQLDVGGMPAFAGSVGSSLIGAVGFDDPNIALVAGAFGGAVVARASGGWHPFAKAGFEITGGYTFISLSGNVSPADVAKVAGGGYATEVTSKLQEDLSISSQLHNFHVGLGWRWIVAKHIVIRAGLGYTQTLASSSTVEIPDDPKAEGLANARVDTVTDEIYRTYFKLPVLSLAGGYRF